MEFEEEQCSLCMQLYPKPVGHHHSERECIQNQKLK